MVVATPPGGGSVGPDVGPVGPPVASVGPIENITVTVPLRKSQLGLSCTFS